MGDQGENVQLRFTPEAERAMAPGDAIPVISRKPNPARAPSEGGCLRRDRHIIMPYRPFSLE